MAREDGNQLRAAIRGTLALRAGRVPNVDTTAEAAASTWRLVTEQLAPVIGARGLDVLLRRALHQTSIAFPWLEVLLNSEASDSVLPSFIACLADQQLSTAAEASYALLTTFTELLATLIGEPLTTRLLAPVWASPSMFSDQESAL